MHPELLQGALKRPLEGLLWRESLLQRGPRPSLFEAEIRERRESIAPQRTLPALALDFFFPKDLLGQVLIVRPTKQPKIPRFVTAAESPRPDVIALEKMRGPAALAARADESALAPISHKDLAPSRSADSPRRFRGTRPLHQSKALFLLCSTKLSRAFLSTASSSSGSRSRASLRSSSSPSEIHRIFLYDTVQIGALSFALRHKLPPLRKKKPSPVEKPTGIIKAPQRTRSKRLPQVASPLEKAVRQKMIPKSPLAPTSHRPACPPRRTENFAARRATAALRGHRFHLEAPSQKMGRSLSPPGLGGNLKLLRHQPAAPPCTAPHPRHGGKLKPLRHLGNAPRSLTRRHRAQSAKPCG